MDLDKRREVILQGRQMRDLLENEAFIGLMDQVLFDTYCQFQALKDPTLEIFTQKWAVHQAVQQIMDRINAIADAGKLEEENKKHDESQ